MSEHPTVVLGDPGPEGRRSGRPPEWPGRITYLATHHPVEWVNLTETYGLGPKSAVGTAARLRLVLANTLGVSGEVVTRTCGHVLWGRFWLDDQAIERPEEVET